MKRARPTPILLSIMACVLVASAASASQLSQVTTKANHIIALNRLELTTEQIAAIAPSARALVSIVKARQTARDRLLAAAANDLATARWRLMSGDPLEADLQARLDKLEALSQIQRNKVPGDRRSYHITLTDTGREFVEGLDVLYSDMVRQVMSDFTEEECQQLVSLTRKLRISLIEHAT